MHLPKEKKMQTLPRDVYTGMRVIDANNNEIGRQQPVGIEKIERGEQHRPRQVARRAEKDKSFFTVHYRAHLSKAGMTLFRMCNHNA